MGIIISLFTDYLKPILIGLASIAGIFLISKTENLKAENQILNDSMQDENQTVQAQNEVIQAVNDYTPVGIDDITTRMLDGKL